MTFPEFEKALELIAEKKVWLSKLFILCQAHAVTAGLMASFL